MNTRPTYNRCRLQFRVQAVLSVLLALLGAFVVDTAGAQSFRGEPSALLRITDGETLRSELEAGQVLLISIPEQFPYVEALRLRLSLTEEAILPSGAFSISVYSAIDPGMADTSGFVTFAGRSLGTVPVAKDQTYTIPVQNPHSTHTRDEASQEIFLEADPKIGVLGIQIAPAMKGLGANLENLRFLLEIAPILTHRGGIKIELTGEDEVLSGAREALRITLNGEPVSEKELYFREPGIYRLDVDGGDYLRHSENVGIQSARTATVLLEAREPRAFLTVHVPSVAEIFLGGRRIITTDRSVIEHPPGSYTLMIRVGDFVISRRVHFEAHREYQIGLDLDILIKEN